MQLIHDARAHLHQPVAMPQQLPQIPILRVRHPDPREAIFQQQPQQQLRVLTIGLLLAYSFGADRSGIADPQLKLQLVQQALKPARMPTGFHAHPHGHGALAEFAVELLGLFLVSQTRFAQFARIRVHVRNLLEARVVITSNNHHVRLLSPEPFVGLAPPKFTRAWEPTLLWNHYTHCPGSARIFSMNERRDFDSSARRRSAHMTNTDQFRVQECGTIVVESAVIDYDTNNRGGNLWSFCYWSDRPPDLQEHTHDAQG